jgi:Ca-activated chloride channel family protein
MIIFAQWRHWPWFLWIIVLIAAVYYLYYTRNQYARALDRSRKFLKHFSVLRNTIKVVLAAIAYSCLGFALLHPQWGEVTDQVEQQGRDLMIALDISRSMLAQDVAPDRLSCAKQAIEQLMQALAADRVALMVFSEKARIYCPLTQDYPLVRLFLEHIDYTTLSAGTTRLDQPIYCAIQQCKRNQQRKHNILLLVSDGEDFSGALAGIKEQAASCGLTILVLGIGTAQGAPIPVYNEQKQRTDYLKDVRGQVVISRLNKSALTTLAENTGGLALFIERPVIKVQDLVDRINQFEQEQRALATVKSHKEQYPWFVFVSFLCLTLEWLL